MPGLNYGFPERLRLHWSGVTCSESQGSYHVDHIKMPQVPAGHHRPGRVGIGPLSDAMAEAPPALIPVGGSGDSDVLAAEMPGAAAAMAAARGKPGSAGGVAEEEIDFDLGGEGSAEGATPKKKKKPKGAVRIMAEVFIGGFGGLFLMYYGLNLFGGKQFDQLPIPLPGISHTDHRWPGGGEQPEDPSQTAVQSPEPAPAEVAYTPEPSPSPSTPTPRPKPRPKRGGLREGGHPLNKIPSDHRTMASLMEAADDDLPPAMAVPKDLKLNRGPPPLADDYLGPHDPPPASSDELGAALKEANEAIMAEDAGLMDEPTYEKFRQLGELVTFARGWPDDTRLSGRKQGVERVLKTIGRDPTQAEAIGRLSKAFLDGGPGNQDGILLSGTSGTPGERNGVYAAVIYLTGQDSTIFVMSDKELPFQKGNNVVVLGTIVVDPAIDLVGLKEPLKWDKGEAVWLGSVANLDE